MCQKVKQADSAYIAGTYGRFDAVMSKGEGAHYEGPDGKRYIDFGTGIGVTLFGACDPDWVAAVTHQLTSLVIRPISTTLNRRRNWQSCCASARA